MGALVVGGAALGIILVGPQMASSAGTTPAAAAQTTGAPADPAPIGSTPPAQPPVAVPSVPVTPPPAAPTTSAVPASTPAAAPPTGATANRSQPAGRPRPAATSAPAVPVDVPQATTEPAPAPAPAPTPAPAPAPAAASGSEEGQVLALVNEARAAAGCAAVTLDAGLTAVAVAHSADMRDRDYFDHTDPDGLSPFDRADRAGATNARAENIARGQADAAAVMEAWLASEDHRQNIVDCSYRTMGLGVATGSGGPWWTQLFGS